MTAVLDEVLPIYRHRERHATQIATAPEAVWSALHAISSGDLRLDLRRRRYGASHGVGPPSSSCQDLREPTPSP